MAFNKYETCQKADIISVKRKMQKSSAIRKITAGKSVGYWLIIILFNAPGFGLAIQQTDTNSIEDQIPFYSCFTNAAEQHDVNRNWLIAVAIIESSLDPTAVSKADAMGIMQIKWPQTAKHLGIDDKTILFDPCSSIEAGARYLREVRAPYIELPLEERNNMMLAAYRIGPNALRKLDHLPLLAQEYIKKVRFEKNGLDQLIELSTGHCILSDFRRLLLYTHHPLTRSQQSINWIRHNHNGCDHNTWKRLINNLPIWLGTAHSNLKLQALLSRLLEK